MKPRIGADHTGDTFRLKRHLEQRLGFALEEVVDAERPSAGDMAGMLQAAGLVAEAPDHETSCARGVAETLVRAGMLKPDGARQGQHLSVVSGNQRRRSSRWQVLPHRFRLPLGRPAWTIASAIIITWGAVRVGLEVSLLLNDKPFFC